MDRSLLLALLLFYLRPTLDHHRPRHRGTLRPLDDDHLHDWGPSVASTASDAGASSVAPKTAAEYAFAFLCASGELPEDYDARQLRKQQKKKNNGKEKKKRRRARRRDARKDDAAASTVPKKPASPEDSSKRDAPKPSQSETSASESFTAESFAPASPLDEELPDDAARRLRKKQKKKQYQKLKKNRRRARRQKAPSNPQRGALSKRIPRISFLSPLPQNKDNNYNCPETNVIKIVALSVVSTISFHRGMLLSTGSFVTIIYIF